MNILKIRVKELIDTFYKDDDYRLDCEYYVIDEGDDIMIPKLKRLETICDSYDDFNEIQEYIYDNFKTIDDSIRVMEFYI